MGRHALPEGCAGGVEQRWAGRASQGTGRGARLFVPQWRPPAAQGAQPAWRAPPTPPRADLAKGIQFDLGPAGRVPAHLVSCWPCMRTSAATALPWTQECSHGNQPEQGSAPHQAFLMPRSTRLSSAASTAAIVAIAPPRECPAAFVWAGWRDGDVHNKAKS